MPKMVKRTLQFPVRAAQAFLHAVKLTAASSHSSNDSLKEQDDDLQLALALSQDDDLQLALALSSSLAAALPEQSEPPPAMPMPNTTTVPAEQSTGTMGSFLACALRTVPFMANYAFRNTKPQAQPKDTRTCTVCMEDILYTADSGMFCSDGHFVCRDCSDPMVDAFLQRVEENDTLFLEHRDRRGAIPCCRHTLSFTPSCQGLYTDDVLARTLSTDTYNYYRQKQNEVFESTVRQDQEDRFQQQIARLQQQFGITIGAYQEQATIQFLRQTYPGARMCPNCRAGPVINLNCFDLTTHHGEQNGRQRYNNACRQCGFFASDWNRWLPWDGVLRTA